MLGFEYLYTAAEAEDPSEQLAAVGHGEGHGHAAIFATLHLLARMPDAIFGPGSRGFVEQQFHVDAGATHDGERILHKRVEVEPERQLIKVVVGVTVLMRSTANILGSLRR